MQSAGADNAVICSKKSEKLFFLKKSDFFAGIALANLSSAVILLPAKQKRHPILLSEFALILNKLCCFASNKQNFRSKTIKTNINKYLVPNLRGGVVIFFCASFF
ncbi:hypothetical protein IKR20_07045 [bacterium]|nr:hypothetical protein [bacterium]